MESARRQGQAAIVEDEVDGGKKSAVVADAESERLHAAESEPDRPFDWEACIYVLIFMSPIITTYRFQKMIGQLFYQILNVIDKLVNPPDLAKFLPNAGVCAAIAALLYQHGHRLIQRHPHR